MSPPSPARAGLWRSLALLLAATALTACHSPASQAQTAQTQTAQTQATQTTIQPTQLQPTRRQSTRMQSTQQAGDTDPVSGLPYISVSALPSEGQQTLRLIQAGGPFPYARDGIVFQNRENILPRRPRGTYHEYTVKTPGSSDRGARRIICATMSECYYTADHYASFARIRS